MSIMPRARLAKRNANLEGNRLQGRSKEISSLGDRRACGEGYALAAGYQLAEWVRWWGVALQRPATIPLACWWPGALDRRGCTGWVLSPKGLPTTMAQEGSRKAGWGGSGVWLASPVSRPFQMFGQQS